MPNQKILIVDDDISVGTVVKLALEDSYDVSVATRAMTAYKHLSKYKVDLVLLDIKMPKVDGLEALKEIKKNHPETFVIMLTAYASIDNIEKARTLGAYGVISKPFEIDELRAYVDEVIAQNRLKEF